MQTMAKNLARFALQSERRLFWVFSPLRFQAEMGRQLLIILSMNMLGGLFLLPAIILLLKPKFVSAQARIGSNLRLRKHFERFERLERFERDLASYGMVAGTLSLPSKGGA